MKLLHAITVFAALNLILCLTQPATASIIGFGQLGGNNVTIPAGLASNATADGNGYTVSNGTTPNITLAWDSGWDIHTSSWFLDLETQTVGGAAWDTDAGNKIGQLDGGSHRIDFTVDAGFKLTLNSFDFAHTVETAGTTGWDIVLTDSGNVTVWGGSYTFDNSQPDTVRTFAPNFTGTDGGDYTLSFDITSQTYTSNGRHGIDNLSFNQVATVVPEPFSLSLISLGVLLIQLLRKTNGWAPGLGPRQVV